MLSGDTTQEIMDLVCLELYPKDLDLFIDHKKIDGQGVQFLLSSVFSISRSIAEVFEENWNARSFPNDSFRHELI